MKSDAEKLKQRQTVKKYLVFALMFLVFAACMWFIFAPSESDRAADEQQKGFNTELPDPRNAGIVDDKMTAYEQESMRQKREEKMRTLSLSPTPALMSMRYIEGTKAHSMIFLIHFIQMFSLLFVLWT